MPQASDVAEMGNPPFNIAKDVLLHHPVRGAVAVACASFQQVMGLEERAF